MKRRRYTSLTLKEIAAVDKPAQENALAVAILKRDAKAKPTGKGWSGYRAPALTSIEDGHQHMLDASASSGETSYTKSEGEEYGHTHPYLIDVKGNVVIGASEGHTHTLLAVAKVAASADEPEEPMTKTETPPAGEKTDADKRLKELETQLATQKALASMTDAQKAHYAKLDDAGKAAFEKAKPEDRETIVTKAAALNQVVYKSADGTEYRADDDPRLVSLAKANDAAARALEVEKAARIDEVYKRRAAAELPHLAGGVETHVAMLKAIDGISDEAVRAKALEALKANDAGLAAAFKRSGATDRSASDRGTAEQEFNALVTKRASESKISVAKATAAVMSTPEGRELYAKYRAEKPVGRP